MDSKAATFDPFRNYPDIQLSDIPLELPPHYRAQMRSLLTQLTPSSSVKDLANSHRDSAGHLVYDSPVVNRPWEWIENLGEPSILDGKDEEREREETERLKARYTVKNSGSLSLETFGARMTGDGIIPASKESRKEGDIRSFEDGLSAESLFKRDWRETRMEVDALRGVGRTKTETDHHEDPVVSSYFPQPRTERRLTPRASPASSVLSRSSAHGSGNSLRRSPGHSALSRMSTSTVGEVDGDSTTTASSSKRTSKRKAAVSSDDEIVVIDGPVPKKPKVKAAPVKTRAKKR